MAVETTGTDANFTGTGVSSSYAPGFYVNSSDQVKVYVDGVLKTLGADYVVNNVGTSTGCTIVATFTLGAAVYIERVTPITQLVDTQNNETILEDVLDAEFDKLTMIAQEISSKAGRALLFPKGESGQTLPAAASRANLFLAFAADGTILLSNGVGTDNGLRSDLASTAALKGAALIGNLGGGTVQDAIFVKGAAAAVIATTAKVAWKREPLAPTYPVASMGSLWPTDKVSWDHAISAEFDATNAPVTTPFVSPSSALLIAAHNKGTDTTMCSLQTICGVHVNGKEASGVNFITYCDAGLTNVKLKGLEIDLQPGAGATILEAFGLALNAFGQATPGDAIFIEGVFGGSWGSGIRVGKLNASIGAGIYGAGAMGTLLDSATGVYGQDAICLTNTHKIRFRDAAGTNPVKMFLDASNFFRFVMPASNGFVFRDNSDTSSLIYIDTGGNLDITGSGVFKKGGTQVLGARKTGWTAATGTATRTTFATGSVTLPVLAEHVKALIDDFISHGAIGA